MNAFYRSLSLKISIYVQSQFLHKLRTIFCRQQKQHYAILCLQWQHENGKCAISSVVRGIDKYWNTYSCALMARKKCVFQVKWNFKKRTIHVGWKVFMTLKAKL